MQKLYTAVANQQQCPTRPSAVAVVATWSPTGAATALSQVLFFYLVQVVHHLQALADQSYLPLHVGHGALHPPHLPLQGGGDGPVVPLSGFILLPQLLVAVVLDLGAVGEYRPTAHVTGLAPVFAVACVGVQVPAEELSPAALVRTGDELVQTAHAVAVLLGEGEGLCTTSDFILTL